MSPEQTLRQLAALMGAEVSGVFPLGIQGRSPGHLRMLMSVGPELQGKSLGPWAGGQGSSSGFPGEEPWTPPFANARSREQQYAVSHLRLVVFLVLVCAPLALFVSFWGLLCSLLSWWFWSWRLGWLFAFVRCLSRFGPGVLFRRVTLHSAACTTMTVVVPASGSLRPFPRPLLVLSSSCLPSS